MARSDEAAPKKKGRIGNIVVWLLMAMLVVGLGGFGLTNFGGSLSNIGSVGSREIDTNQYARALQGEIRALSAQVGSDVTMAQAQAMGLDQRVLQQLVANAALDNEAARVGLSVGDDRVAREVLQVPAFKGANGQFDRVAYRSTLQQNGMSEAGFEAQLRDDLSRSVLQGAVASGVVTPPVLLDTLQAWATERRGFTVLRLTAADLATPLAAPTEAELQAWYADHPADFTAPEAKRITYAALLPEMLADSMVLDEAALREQYDQRQAEFKQPERRLVERLVYPDQAAAEAARARFDAGTPFEDLVAERGLALSDVDLGDQTQAELGQAGAAIFALTEPGVVGPLPSDLGPALYRMNGILAAQETPFEEARTMLAAEQSADAARRAIAGKVEEVNDLLAGGAALADLAADAGMKVATFDYAPGSDEPIAGYTAFQEAAAKVQEGDFPEVISLDDGGIVVLQLDAVVPPTLRPYADVAEDVADAWRADALAKALAARAAEVKAAIEGGAAPGAFGVADVITTITRDGFLEDMPETLMPAVFAMAPKAVQVVEGPGFTGVVRLDSIRPAPGDDAAARAMKTAIAAQVDQAMAQDAFNLFTNALIRDAGVTLNQQAITAVNTQFR